MAKLASSSSSTAKGGFNFGKEKGKDSEAKNNIMAIGSSDKSQGEQIQSELQISRNGSPTGTTSSKFTPPDTPPPRKAWEFYYRTFLNRLPSSPQNHSDRTKRNSAPGHALDLLPPPLIPALSEDSVPKLEPKTTTSATAARNPKENLLQDLRRDPDLGSSSLDTSVRGGSLFKNIFKNKKKSGANHKHVQTPHLPGDILSSSFRQHASHDSLDRAITKPKKSFLGKSSSSTKLQRKKSLSYDSLDQSMRRGCEKKYNPENNAHVQPPFQQEYVQPRSYPGTGTLRPLVSLRERSISDGGNAPIPQITPKRNIAYEEGHSLHPASHQRSSSMTLDPLSISSKDRNTEHRRNQSKEMKIAFTEFHNSNEYGKDSTSPYLGDETSYHNGSLFQPMYERGSYHHHSVMKGGVGFTSSSQIDEKDKFLSSQCASILPPVDENVTWSPNIVLTPIQGVESWKKGHEYLIAPAVIAMCPVQVISILSGEKLRENQTNTKLSTHDNSIDDIALPKLENSTVDGCPPPVKSLLLPKDKINGSTIESVKDGKLPIPFSCSSSPFEAVILGKAAVATIGSRLSGNDYCWTNAQFVLRQNYLLEYGMRGNMKGKPRGISHLQFSIVSPCEKFEEVFQLEICDGPPRLGGQRRTVLIRVTTREDRDRWMKSLKNAAKLTIEDLYELDANGTELGKGRYALVRPARRKCYTSQFETTSSKDTTRYNSDSRRHHIHQYALENGESSMSEEKYDCALKIVDKKQFWDRVRKGKERIGTLVRESSVQATLSVHAGLPTILQLRSFFETADSFILELELLEGTDLFQHVSFETSLDEDEAARIMRDILHSLALMRQHGIAHRDIKPANILMCDANDSDGVSVKLGDYGMATFVGDDNLLRGRCGTPGYVAPEILLAGVNGGYPNKVDIFSAGVTLYVLLCGYEPFYGETDAELVTANKLAKVEFPEVDWGHISKDAKDLIRRMIEVDHEKRIDPETALRHPWILKRSPPVSWEGKACTECSIRSEVACSMS